MPSTTTAAENSQIRRSFRTWLKWLVLGVVVSNFFFNWQEAGGPISTLLSSKEISYPQLRGTTEIISRDSNSSNLTLTLPDSTLAALNVDSSTGSLFQGNVIRKYTGERISLQSVKPTLSTKSRFAPTCENWAVVTTIFAPSLAIERAALLPEDWCTVVVADTKTPDNYQLTLKEVLSKKVSSSQASAALQRIKYLSVEEQRRWGTETGPYVSAFVQSIPFRHFARKNIGYLYAIRQGAKILFDFDDDNILDTLDDNDPSSPVVPPVLNTTHVSQVRWPILGKLVLNHHPLMGASFSTSWPRGFPLSAIQDNTTHGTPGAFLKASPLPMERVGVLQLCAQDNPDVDAIHRLVQPLPMTFDNSQQPLLVPPRVFAPTNAQATVHTRSALFATLLPATVPGRVSDIWRGYLAKRLLDDVDLAQIYLAPHVRQDRNVHDYMADLAAELDLYLKTNKLLEFLDCWVPPKNSSLPERMEALWIDSYERGYIELGDVELMQKWLQALVEVEYDFVPIRHERRTRLAVMGQFNFAAMDVEKVIFWVQKWRQITPHVQVRGDFQEWQLASLSRNGVTARHGPEPLKAGFVSPVGNLGNALMEYKNREDVDGIMYIHDDAMIDITKIPIKPDRVVVNKVRNGTSPWYEKESWIHKVLPNGNIQQKTGEIHNASQIEQYVKALRTKNWPNWHWCVDSFRNFAMDPLSAPMRELDGSMLQMGPARSDFIYVPTKFAEKFDAASKLAVKHNNFLECAMPNLVQILRNTANLTSLEKVQLCQDCSSGGSGTVKHFKCCIDRHPAIIHPVKLTSGLDAWGDAFDRLAFGQY